MQHSNTNFFQIFGLPLRYFIDTQELRNKYFELSKTLHPDFFTQSSPQEQEQKLAEAAQLNLAFKTLSSERLRLEYLLQYFGFLDSALQNQTEVQLSPTFLMEMIELNEALETATSDELSFLKEKLKRLEQEREELIQKILLNFDSIEENSLKKQELKKVLLPYLELKYILRTKENLLNL
ncbi:MAG: Fe-S protein assembly co-chaperone HscB [Bacteroidia bacterium]|nr:Fe-S protein assembly co-chaperone HscB [Bacteroidia bacterium]MDW8157657.1 Fe-S protein assembly co-chaperone HscB [Bacteroidia bacterium]